jgi:hypothetical protein
MYTKQIPHKNFLGKVRNQTVHFNLTTHEFFKLLVEFKAIFDWQDRLEKENDPDAVTDTREIVAYYNNFEEILLSACMEMFVQDPEETSKLVEAMVPEGLAELIKKLDANAVAMIANEETPEAMKRELERLRAQEAAREAQALAQKSSSDS